ncbi:MAG: tetratricopeptide repeat protein, partial [Streptomyces sp.]|nr:tetratricopeptide repeat protein [Streptomyces sp.]
AEPDAPAQPGRPPAESGKPADAYPPHERVHVRLMQALASAGRRAEALEAYEQARRALVAELGVEPGPELRELHGRILAGEEVRAPRPEPAPPAGGAVPRQLPAAAGHFTGRHAEIAVLTGLVGGGPDAVAGRTVVICAVDGMAGIGKTALAVHTGHRLAERFPDGQLFLDLHGYTEGVAPREPGQALEWLLRALGVPPWHIPEEVQARAALYRQRLADTRTLIVLDNAASEAQVRQLLPGAPGCLVLLTSRRRLKGLDDAHTVSLDLLPPDDAHALLRAVAGPDRVTAGDPLLEDIAQWCGRLPLALRIAGALLRHRPAWTLEHLAHLLRDQQRRVPALSDGERDLATVFDLSYAGLGERHRLLIRRLAPAPGPDVDSYAAAALLAADPDDTTGLLEDLVDHNLLIAHAPGRYRLHDLVRAHAHALAATDPPAERDAAVDRLLHYYAHTAQRASIPVGRYPRPEPDGLAPAHAPAVTSPESAWAWLRTERDNLEAASAYAQAGALHGHAVALAAGLAEILCVDGPYSRVIALLKATAETAERHGHPWAYALALTYLGGLRRLTGDLPGAADTLAAAFDLHCVLGNRLGEAAALTELGTVRRETGDLPAAGEAVTGALEIYRELGNRLGEATALTELGTVRRETGDLPGAGDAHLRALEIYRALGNRRGQAKTLIDLAHVRSLVGDFAAAVDALTPALEICRANGHRDKQAYALLQLGRAWRRLGDLPGAAGAVGQALEIFRALRNRNREAEVLVELGLVRQSTGDPQRAADAVGEALGIFRALRNRASEAWALNHQAAIVAAAGDQPRALALYGRALAMHRELNKPTDEAVALEGLGECHLAAGETGPGITYLEQAHAIFRHLGMTADADRVRTRLADVGHPAPRAAGGASPAEGVTG